jgi:hypothetical protein
LDTTLATSEIIYGEGPNLVRDEHMTPLWSRRTAEEIEAVLAEDLAVGHLTAAEVADLVARVRARVQR